MVDLGELGGGIILGAMYGVSSSCEEHRNRGHAPPAFLATIITSGS